MIIKILYVKNIMKNMLLIVKNVIKIYAYIARMSIKNMK